MFSTYRRFKMEVFLGSKVNGVVPGGIYSDLMRTKMLEDIYLGDNDQNFRWLSKNDWTYTKTFKGN